MFSKIFRAVILGAPASGKGTISKRMVDKYGFVHISPGDILRLNVLQNTQLGQQAKSYMDAGQLVPDEIITQTILQRVQQLHKQPWLLDGFPRTLNQALELNQATKLDAVIALNVPHHVIIERVKNRWIHLPSGRVYNIGFNDPKVPGKDDVTGEDLVQRDDDKPEVLQRRLRVYENEILKPITEFYAKHNLLTEFSGETTVEIWPKVEKFLAERKALLA